MYRITETDIECITAVATAMDGPSQTSHHSNPPMGASDWRALFGTKEKPIDCDVSDPLTIYEGPPLVDLTTEEELGRQSPPTPPQSPTPSRTIVPTPTTPSPDLSLLMGGGDPMRVCMEGAVSSTMSSTVPSTINLCNYGQIDVTTTIHVYTFMESNVCGLRAYHAGPLNRHLIPRAYLLRSCAMTESEASKGSLWEHPILTQSLSGPAGTVQSLIDLMLKDPALWRAAGRCNHLALAAVLIDIDSYILSSQEGSIPNSNAWSVPLWKPITVPLPPYFGFGSSTEYLSERGVSVTLLEGRCTEYDGCRSDGAEEHLFPICTYCR